jgi:hypothetical protein
MSEQEAQVQIHDKLTAYLRDKYGATLQNPEAFRIPGNDMPVFSGEASQRYGLVTIDTQDLQAVELIQGVSRSLEVAATVADPNKGIRMKYGDGITADSVLYATVEQEGADGKAIGLAKVDVIEFNKATRSTDSGFLGLGKRETQIIPDTTIRSIYTTEGIATNTAQLIALVPNI